MAAPSKTRALLEEPLLHFAVLAAVVFGLHRLLAEDPTPAPAPAADDALVIDDAFVDGLVEQERLATGRAPDRDAVTRRWIRDEVLAREATRLGLADHDPVVRRRLVQLAELWLEASVELPEPTDEQLAFVLERDRARYAAPGAVAFEHVFFASARADATGDARAARERLEAGTEAAALGDPFLLGARIAARTDAELRGSFGPPFAAAVAALEGDGWSEPIESSYGVHLVRVTSRTPPRAPTLDEVRDRVRADWMAERLAAETRAAVERVRARYVVERR
ncbi:MAG: peptidyl-prolyl cis-trans isomerase [Sandaracinaceae bacterium]|nr:peptidyl-prolyl cis-trans isomerase [Sandaracinaceae bacterium]